MSKAVRFIVLVVAALTCALPSALTSAEARTKIASLHSFPNSTHLLVYNAYSADVDTTITVPAGSVCGSGTINDIKVTDTNTGTDCPVKKLGSGGLQGFFKLHVGETVEIESKLGQNCLGGVNVAFIAPPQCPCTSCTGFVDFVALPFPLPNGVNQAEVTLNPASPNQEAVNISCNTGANSTINITATGGPAWTAPPPTRDTFSITNSWVNVPGAADNNCNLLGVLAYQLTTCTAGPNACPGGGPFCTQSGANCILQRVGSGGTVKVSYLGPLSPP